MRLLLRLRCTEKCDYEMNYHYHLQGLIYNLIKDTQYAHIHDKGGFKFFCYSNIIPISSPIMNDDIRTLIISSPDVNFISVLQDELKKLTKMINIGTMKFKVRSVQRLEVKIPTNGTFTMITGTPIIIRIPQEKYKKYGIKPAIDYEYLYWRADHPLELFISQVWENLQRKYNEYFKIDLPNRGLYYNTNPFQIFDKFIFRKQISTKMFVKNTEQTVIGTTWEFLFQGLEYKDMIQFALDVGLGERNSMGFGFMNLKKRT
jgi:CRISPR-associated endoribonuclease Cas6